VFRAPRLGKVAGCYVTEGEINRNAKARVVRDGVVIYQGRIISLRRFKDDVPTVAAGFECGIGLENFRDVKVGDTIESFEVREIARV
jgi:translation initiation factor IF-2